MPNPFYQAMMGNMQAPMVQPASPVQALLQQATEIYQTIQSPQAFMQRYFPRVPNQFRNNADQLLNYLQQTGSITPQQISFLNQFPCPMR